MADQVSLPDGRTLGIAEYGRTDGPVVLYFHGWPSCRLEGRLLDEAARAAGVRLLALDRPGCGRSTLQPQRHLLQWPRDVSAWAEAEGVERFGVLGFSGGGPYALACAFAIPERLRAVAVVSGMTPPEAVTANPETPPAALAALALSGIAPGLMALLWRKAARQWQKEPEAVLERMFGRLTSRDRSALEPHRPVLAEAIQEAIRPGTDGVAWEAGLYVRPWGFALGDVKLDVQMWHGEEDENMPVALARWTAEQMPRVRTRFLAEEAHFSTLLHNAPEILRGLAPSGQSA